MHPQKWLDISLNRLEILFLAFAFFTLGIVFYLLIYGYAPLVAFLLFIPVMVWAYRYEESGIYFASFLGIVYFIGEFLIHKQEIPTLLLSAGNSAMLIIVAWVVATLSLLLRSEHLRYQGVFENTLSGIILLKNSDFTVLEANDRFGKMIGRDGGGLSGTVFQQLWQEQSEWEDFCKILRKDGKISEFEAPLRTSKGPIWVILSATKLDDDTIVCTLTDITQRKQAEQLISVANAINQHIVHETDIMRLINRSCSEFGRLDPYFVVSISLLQSDTLVPVTITQQQYAAVNNALLQSQWVTDAVKQKEITWNSDLEYASQKLFTGAYAFPMLVVFESKGVLIVYLTSEKILNDQELETYQTLANDLAFAIKSMEIEQQKLAALEQIEKNLENLATLNDEIRNPLQAILSFAELEQMDFARKIYQEVGKIDSLVNQLDIRWVESDKIRKYLAKHHGLKRE